MHASDFAINRLAAKQFGLVTRAQALVFGLEAEQIHWRVRTQRWEVVTRGVYRVAGTPSDWRQLTAAACMSTSHTVASHFSAAAIAGIYTPPPKPHVTVPFTSSARMRLATVHRTRLDPLDIEERDGIPSTTIARALVDCAGRLGRAPLGRLLDDAMHAKLTTVPSIDGAIERAGPRRGLKLLAELVDPWRTGIEPGSPAEVRLIRQLIEWGYPQPTSQILICNEFGEIIARADLGWEPRRIGIEYDSERWHGPSAWAHDEARHRRVAGTGWTLLHADKTDLLPGERAFRHELDEAWRRSTFLAA